MILLFNFQSQIPWTLTCFGFVHWIFLLVPNPMNSYLFLRPPLASVSSRSQVPCAPATWWHSRKGRKITWIDRVWQVVYMVNKNFRLCLSIQPIYLWFVYLLNLCLSICRSLSLCVRLSVCLSKPSKLAIYLSISIYLCIKCSFYILNVHSESYRLHVT